MNNFHYCIKEDNKVLIHMVCEKVFHIGEKIIFTKESSEDYKKYEILDIHHLMPQRPIKGEYGIPYAEQFSDVIVAEVF